MQNLLSKVVPLVAIMQGCAWNTLCGMEHDVSSSIDDSISTSKSALSSTKEEMSHRFNLFFKCGGDEKARRNAIEQRVQEYLAAGGTPNLCNEFGTNLLHMASCYGHEAMVTLLVEQYRANVMTVDHLGCVPGDYARKALITGMHPFSDIQDKLTTRENIAFEQRRSGVGKEDVAPASVLVLRSFMDAFNDTCHATFVGNQAQRSGKVVLPQSALSSIFNFLGNVVPLPGASVVAVPAVIAADEMERRRVEHRTNQYFGNAPRELSREFMKLAYVLSQRYERAILELSDDGARGFGKYCADKIEEYLCKENEYIRSINRDQSFVNQVLDYLHGLRSAGMGITSATVRLQQGGTWKTKEILNGTNPEIPTTSWPLPLADRSASDQIEMVRLERLLSNLSLQDVVPLSSDSRIISSMSSLSPSITSSIDQSPISVGNVTSSKDSIAVGIFGADGKVGTVSGNGGLAGGVVVEEASTGRHPNLNARVGEVTASGGGNAYGVFVGNVSMFLPKK